MVFKTAVEKLLRRSIEFPDYRCTIHADFLAVTLTHNATSLYLDLIVVFPGGGVLRYYLISLQLERPALQLGFEIWAAELDRDPGNGGYVGSPPYVADLAASLHRSYVHVIPALVLLWSVATTAYASYNQERTLKRIAGDSALRYVVSHLSLPQLQATFGTTIGTYETWTKATKLPVTVEELGEGGRLLWIGPKRLERVVLFIHGGGFVLPPGPMALSFWRYVQLELEKQNIEVGFAMLNYSLAPHASFPTPLKQASLALNFLMAAGVKPQNLQLAGDSAGGNIVLQVLSQMLHPREGVPEIRLSAPLRGMYLISPWMNLCADGGSHVENEGRDFITQAALKEWGAHVLPTVPAPDRPFAEAIRAPDGWFKGAEAHVERVLITAGSAELMRDDIVAFSEAFKKHHANTELVVQKGGLHEDMFLDFAVNEKKLSSLTPLTVEWLAAGFTAEPSA
ncbi:Abhydrolase-3 domain-containing protein [Mycena venus]|uniref:Abhydrolase-3 domain-containing protein n=1 Tax=Mycena venus TaxID=2733690 RepID=A0A8H6U353_9AGAR|nr:Abhydrolase-3 domain-containing protein [Mycena venus]